MIAIHKEIEKKKYLETPVGKLEKELRKIWEGLRSGGKTLPESVSKEIYDLRDEHEKTQMQYVEEYKKQVQALNDEHAKKIDAKLVKVFTKEIELLKKYL